MPLIENTPMFAITNGTHRLNPKNSILISIRDPDDAIPEPKYDFVYVHHFAFHDAEPDSLIPNEKLITDKEALEIITILQKAKSKDLDVVVHCGAGVCRSGAVVEAGIVLGFVPVHKNRIPNLYVKKKLFDVISNIGV